MTHKQQNKAFPLKKMVLKVGNGNNSFRSTNISKPCVKYILRVSIFSQMYTGVKKYLSVLDVIPYTPPPPTHTHTHTLRIKI